MNKNQTKLLDENFFEEVEVILKDIKRGHYLPSFEKEKTSYLSPEIRIGTWGQFSSGKSSFINSILGREVLPINILELTSMTTEVVYGKEELLILNPEAEAQSFPYSPELSVILLAGMKNWAEVKPTMKTKLSEDRFHELKNQIEMLNFGITKVQLTIDCELLKSGIILVDLPGLGGSKDKARLAEGRIEDCEIILYLKGTDRPMDKYEWEVINLLKKNNSGKVTFALRTKSDDLFKNRYSETSETVIDDEKLYQIEKEKFREEVKTAQFDDCFLLSPIAISAIRNNNGDLAAAKAFLRSKHKSKFLFLDENSRLDIISGQKFLEEDFFRSIEGKRMEAKLRKAKGSLRALLEKISQELDEGRKTLTSEEKIDKDELQRFEKELTRIKSKFLGLESIESRIDQIVGKDLQYFLSNQYENWVQEAFNSHDATLEYESANDIFLDIQDGLQEILSLKTQDESFQRELQKIIHKGHSGIKKDLEEIEEIINEFSDKLFRERTSVTELSNDLTNNVKIGEGIALTLTRETRQGVIGGIAGSIALDIVTDMVFENMLGMLGGFGITTIAAGAYRGLRSGKGVVQGIEDGLMNTLDGAAYMLGSFFGGGQSAEARLLQRKLSNPSDRRSIALSFFKNSQQNFTSNFKLMIYQNYQKKIAEENVLDLIRLRLTSMEQGLQAKYDARTMSLSEKSEQLARMKHSQESFHLLLHRYGII